MSRDLYSNFSGSEIDLRTEFINFLSGNNGELPKKKTHLLRRMRLDTDNNRIACTCVSSLTREPDEETECPFCLGEGYLWDEVWLYCYSKPVETEKYLASKKVRLPSGDVTSYDRSFYCFYDENISYYDKIIELKLDSEGKPTLPYRRQSIYRIEAVSDYRGDFSKREFLVIYCTELSSIRVRNNV